MKTIQKVLSELNAEEVINYYFATYPINIFKDLDHEWDNKTVAECKDYDRNKLRNLIDRVVSTKENTSVDKKSILFVYKRVEDGFYDGLDVSLLDAKELLDAKDVSQVCSYAYEFERLEDTVGYLVADTPLTQNNLLEVATSYLYEVSFFGYEQEYLEEEKKKLDEAVTISKDSSKKHSFSSFEELRESLGLPEEEVYPEEEDKRRAFQNAVLEYNNYCSAMEKERIKKSLLEATRVRS